MKAPETATIVPVREIMQHDVRTTTPECPIADVARLLIEHNLTGLPVVDASGALVGVVTEYDIVSKRGATVGDIMSRGVVSVTEETSAARVVELVGLHGIRGIPVLREGALIGLITRADLVRLYLALRWQCATCGHEDRGISAPRACSSCGGATFNRSGSEVMHETTSADPLLQELFSSRMRALVLSQMLPRPQVRSSLTDLSRLLDQPISSLQHECYKLERLGLLRGKREGNTRRYEVVSTFPLLRPMTSLIATAIGPERALRAALESVPGLDFAFFAGELPVNTANRAARVVLVGDVPLEAIDAVQERSALALNLPTDLLETAYYRRDDWRERLRQQSAYAVALLNGPRVDLVGSPDQAAG